MIYVEFKVEISSGTWKILSKKNVIYVGFKVEKMTFVILHIYTSWVESFSLSFRDHVIAYSGKSRLWTSAPPFYAG